METERDERDAQKEPVIEQPGQQTPKMAVPVCPHCGDDPCRVVANVFQLGDITCMEFHCPNCRKLLPISFLGREQPRVVTAMDPGLIPRGRG